MLKKILPIMLIMLMIALSGCEEAVKPTRPSRGNIPQIEISIPVPLPEKPRYEPPPSIPSEGAEHKIDAREFEFLPREIKVNEGDYVRLVVTARDVDQHIYVDAFGIDEELPLGEDVYIEFKADKTGKFIYRSDKATMQGLLVVQ